MKKSFPFEYEADIWEQYKAIKRDGERKAVFELITKKMGGLIWHYLLMN